MLTLEWSAFANTPRMLRGTLDGQIVAVCVNVSREGCAESWAWALTGSPANGARCHSRDEAISRAESAYKLARFNERYRPGHQASL